MLTRAKVLGDRGERGDDVVIAAAADLVQRPGAVLAARPGDQRLALQGFASLLLAALRRHAAVAAPRLRLPRGASCVAPRLLLGRHDDAAARSGIGRALAGFPGAADRAPQRLVHCFAARKKRGRAAAPSECGATAGRPPRPPRMRRARKALIVPLRRMAARDRLSSTSAPNSSVSHSMAKAVIAPGPLAASSRPN